MPFPLAGLAIPAVVKSLPWKVIGVGVAVVVCFFLLLAGVRAIERHGYEAGKKEVQDKWDADIAARAAAYAKLVEDTRLREQQMNADQAAAREEKKRDEARLAAAQRRIADLLRNRPERPADMSASAAAVPADQGGPRCTGAGLFRADAEFLAGQSARADDLRIALKECYAWHDSVLKALRPDAPR